MFSDDFWTQRDTKKREYEEKGYIDIDDLDKIYHIPIWKLQDADIIKNKKIRRLPYIYDIQPTMYGRLFFRTINNYELILLRPNKLNFFNKKFNETDLEDYTKELRNQQ